MNMKFGKKLILSSLLAIVLSIGCFLQADASAVQRNQPNRDRAEYYDKIDKIVDYIKENYYGSFDETQIYERLIKATLSDLDAHSYYMNPEEARSFIENIEGNFFGIGVQIQKTDAGILITKVFEGSPAKKANLQKGDLIIGVDGTDLRGMPLDKAVSLIRGEEGAIAKLEVKKWNRDVINVFVKRAKIDNLSAELEVVDGVPVLKLYDFSMNSLEQFNKIMAKNKHVKKMIIDLRGNPGGLLKSAVAISDAFLPQGALITTAKYKSQEDVVFRASKEFYDMKLVILIDENSASASEILAGALKDNKKALLIGNKTYGKGSIQAFSDVLKDDSLVKLTIGEYLLPSGVSINRKGIVPDIEIQRERIFEDFYPMNSLNSSKIGDRDIDSYGMEQRLNLLGYPIKSDGKFDQKSEDALKDWQLKNGLKATGILDVETKIKLEADARKHYLLNADPVLDRAIIELKKM